MSTFYPVFAAHGVEQCYTELQERIHSISATVGHRQQPRETQPPPPPDEVFVAEQQLEDYGGVDGPFSSQDVADFVVRQLDTEATYDGGSGSGAMASGANVPAADASTPGRGENVSVGGARASEQVREGNTSRLKAADMSTMFEFVYGICCTDCGKQTASLSATQFTRFATRAPS